MGVVLLFVWLLSERSGPQTMREPAASSASADPLKKESRSPRGSVQKSAAEELLTHPDILFVASRLEVEPRVLADRATRTKAIMENKNVEIRFYGQVVDQDDKPLSGVTVRAGVREWAVKNLFEPVGRSHYQTKISGLDGVFTFDSLRGDVLDIESIQKEGYVVTTKQKKGFSYGPLPHHFTPNPLDPVIYRMWKTNGAVRLYRVQVGGSIPQDGTPVPLDLRRCKRATEPGLDTDLRIILQHGAPPEQRGFQPRFPWRFTIEVPDGGVIETQDEFMYLAPEAGYQSKWTMDTPKDAPDWKARRELEFYLRNRDGQQHGRLKVMFKVEPGGTGYFAIEGFLNPAGRVLEMDDTVTSLARPPMTPAAPGVTSPAPGPFLPPGFPGQTNRPAPFIPLSPPGFQALTNRTNPLLPLLPTPPRPTR